MNQKEFLFELEQTCGVNKSAFLDTGDTWEYPEGRLKRAKDLTNLPVIGRYRLTLENSKVSELWFDLEIPEDKEFKELAKLTLDAIEIIKSFGITDEYIYVKLSGHGIHIQVFISGLRGWTQLKALAKVIHQKLPMSKAHSLGSDPRCLVEHQKIREFGAQNGEHFTTLYKIDDLRKAKRKKKYPINKKAEAVVYPKIKVFECTKQMINRIHELEGEFELSKETETYGSEVDYDKDGDIQNLYKCFTIARLAEKAKKGHLTHAERLAICQTFICFGEDGQDEIHKILSQCEDYSKEYTQWVIEDNKKRGYRPFTCQWIKDHVDCPEGCKGSGGKSPFKFAWKPLSLKEIIEEYRKILVLHDEDEMLIEVCLALILDTKISGDLVWLFLVAPPSSGKTVILNSLHNPAWSIKTDSITARTLVTGKTRKEPKTGEDIPIEGLLPKLHLKTLIIKDFTTQLMRGEDVRKEIFGQLRAIYDEEYAQFFGSFDIKHIPEHWKHVRMGFLAGCTQYLDRYGTLNKILGERYLKIRLKTPDILKSLDLALSFTGTLKRHEKILRKKVTRFLSNLEIPPESDLFAIPKEYRDMVKYLAWAIVLIRKPVSEREALTGIRILQTEEDTERPMRLAKQFARLGMMLRVVKETKWTLTIMRTIQRVAFDTLHPSRAKIVDYLYGTNKPATENEIRTHLHWGHQRIRMALRKMAYGRIVIEENQQYTLDPTIRRLLNKSRLQVLPLYHYKKSRIVDTTTKLHAPHVQAPDGKLILKRHDTAR